MQNSLKVSFSLPKEDYEEMETIRRRMGLERSVVIDMAIRFWLDKLEEEELVRQYQEGYKRIPEKINDLKIIERAQLETFDLKEGW